MEKTNKKHFNMVVVTILGILLIMAGIFVYQKYFNSNPVTPSGGNVPAITGDTVDLVSFSIAPGSVVSDAVTATGALKGVYFFEARAQGQLLDSSKNVKSTFALDATSNWMTADAVNFTAIIDPSGVPAGLGYIRLHNDNPSGDPARDKYVDIPVVFQ